MQVSRISFTSNIPQSQKAPQKLANLDNRFMYQTPSKPKEDVKVNIARVATAFATAIAITGLSVLNIKRLSKHFVSKSVVELADKTKGLNKITKYAGNVKQLKNEILYPYVATMKGDKYFAESGKLKSGMILAGDNSHDVCEMINAFREHAKELGLKVVPCPYKKLKTQEAARNWVYNTFAEAEKNYKEKGEYTFIEIGKVDFLFKEKVKSKAQENEKILNFFKEGNKTKEGVFWSAWTENSDKWPFFHESPVLITKLV